MFPDHQAIVSFALPGMTSHGVGTAVKMMMSLCGMRTTAYHPDRKALLSWTFLAIAALGSFGSSYGQGEPLTAIAEAPAITHVAKATQPLVTLAPGHQTVGITDDGHQGDERWATSQLIFAFECEHPRSVTVDLFNEQGLQVGSSRLMPMPGRKVLALDVAHLREGRYAARITEGGGAKVVRFHR